MNQKGMVGILFLIAILIISVGAGAFYLGKVSTQKSNTPNITSSVSPEPSVQVSTQPTSFKYYSNAKWRLSFSYPPNLALEDRTVDYPAGNPDYLDIDLNALKPNTNPSPTPLIIPGSATDLLNQKMLEHGAAASSSNTIPVYYLFLYVYSSTYDQHPREGITRGEIEDAIKNAQVGQIYQRTKSSRKFIKVSEEMINGVKFTKLKVQAISDVVIPGQPDSYGEYIEVLNGGNLYEFSADDTSYFKQILQTVRFNQ